ncbi:MAG: hypothetical protein L0J84_14380, partial [Brachybacterium sp.]|nr:hypothetical protein [Brachybacterium sp.]
GVRGLPVSLAQNPWRSIPGAESLAQHPRRSETTPRCPDDLVRSWRIMVVHSACTPASQF